MGAAAPSLKSIAVRITGVLVLYAVRFVQLAAWAAETTMRVSGDRTKVPESGKEAGPPWVAIT